MNEGDISEGLGGVFHVVACAEDIHGTRETSFVCTPNFFWRAWPPKDHAPTCLWCVARRRFR